MALSVCNARSARVLDSVDVDATLRRTRSMNSWPSCPPPSADLVPTVALLMMEGLCLGRATTIWQ